MHADKARELVLRHDAERSMPAVYKKIESAASRGEGSCYLNRAELSEFQTDLLRSNGYWVEAVDEDSSFDARVVGYRVIWVRG